MRYVIASRGSQLARAQANRVQNQLAVLFPEHTWEIQTFTTQGDKLIDRPLSSFGGKGAFLKEIEEALLNGSAHLAVHSLKDVPVQTTKGLMLAAYLFVMIHAMFGQVIRKLSVTLHPESELAPAVYAAKSSFALIAAI